jgi:exodeoxyribonuclease-3
MKIVSYNVNGIRSALSKNLALWIQQENPDVICLQEIKASPEQFDTYLFETMGYHSYWHPAVKKGYSGVAILSREKPDNVTIGCGNKQYDDEGRMLRADFGDISVMSLYLPSGSSGEERQGFKMEFCNYFHGYISQLLRERPNFVVSGDINICHRAMDIHDPVRNAKSSGFLPEERDWLGKLLEVGFTDSYRHINPDSKKYSWWSFRSGARSNNKGWRIDYHLVSEALKDAIADAEIFNEAIHSDHCPIMVELKR